MQKNNQLFLQVEQIQPLTEWQMEKTLAQCLPKELPAVFAETGTNVSFFDRALLKAYKTVIEYNYSAYEAVIYRICLPKNHAQLLKLMLALDECYKQDGKYDADYVLFGKESIDRYITPPKRAFAYNNNDRQHLEKYGTPPAETTATLTLPMPHFIALAKPYQEELHANASKTQPTMTGYLWNTMRSSAAYVWNQMNDGVPQEAITIQLNDTCVDSTKADKDNLLIANYLMRQLTSISNTYSFLEAIKLADANLSADERGRAVYQLKEYVRGPIEVLGTLSDFVKAKGQKELSEEVEEVLLIKDNLFNMPAMTNYGSFFATPNNPAAITSVASAADDRAADLASRGLVQ